MAFCSLKSHHWVFIRYNWCNLSCAGAGFPQRYGVKQSSPLTLTCFLMSKTRHFPGVSSALALFVFLESSCALVNCSAAFSGVLVLKATLCIAWKYRYSFMAGLRPTLRHPHNPEPYVEGGVLFSVLSQVISIWSDVVFSHAWWGGCSSHLIAEMFLLHPTSDRVLYVPFSFFLWLSLPVSERDC